MNEFIVWDKKRKIFLDKDTDFKKLDSEEYDRFYDMTEWYPICEASMLFTILSIDKDIFSVHNLLRVDESGCKVYAACSIVELVGSSSRGYFFFDDEYLKYKFAFNGDKTVSMGMDGFEKSVAFKVIGTLQENPELLQS